MRLDVGRDTWRSRRTQRWLRARGIVLGLRESYRDMGKAGLWLACLSRTEDMRSAISLYRFLTAGKKEAPRS